MKKYIRQLLLICTILCILSYNSYAKTCNDKSYYILKESTVKLIMKKEIENEGFEYFACTGIIVYKDEVSTGILTSQHCVGWVKKASYVVVDYKFPVSKIYSSKILDIAYLEINKSIRHKNPVDIATYNAQHNELIYTLGYPNIAPLYSCAKVSYSTTAHTYSDAKIVVGCSGSGVINGRGKLVGIFWGAYAIRVGGKQTGDSIMINTESIRKFLYKINKLNPNLVLIK